MAGTSLLAAQIRRCRSGTLGEEAEWAKRAEWAEWAEWADYKPGKAGVIMRNPRLWSIAAILLVVLSGCTRRSGVPVTPSGTASAPVAAAGCGKAAPTASGTTIEATITSDGMQRTYRLHVPRGYDSNHPTPLVLDIHGHDETALQEERYTLYSVLAD